LKILLILHLKTPPLYPAAQTHQEADDSADQEYDEENLCNARGAYGNTTESEKRCDQGDYEKYDCIMEHERTLIV
jgi:hypothetical protein